MTMPLSGRERGAGRYPGGARCAEADIRRRCFVHGCCLMTLMLGALMLSEISRAEYAESLFAEATVPADASVDTSAAAPVSSAPFAAANASHVTQTDFASDSASDPPPAGEAMTIASFGPPPLTERTVVVEYASRDTGANDMRGPSLMERHPVAMPMAQRGVSLHVDDITTASGLVDARVRALALALDAEVPRMGGVTIQPRVEMAYRPPNPALPSFMDPSTDISATGLAVRLYGSKPTRLSGVYPFVEADWWQDNRAKVININGTRIDTDLLRGLFSFNIGAHSNSTTGMRLWFKVKAGSKPSGTIGARYRW